VVYDLWEAVSEENQHSKIRNNKHNEQHKTTKSIVDFQHIHTKWILMQKDIIIMDVECALNGKSLLEKVC
jgi:hypothetical protein